MADGTSNTLMIAEKIMRLHDEDGGYVLTAAEHGARDPQFAEPVTFTFTVGAESPLLPPDDFLLL